jgi:CRISPR-associated exonuclease Cas4
MGWLLAVAILLGILGFWLLIRSGVARRETGMPVGRIVYVDAGGWKRTERPLFSAQHRLAGRPDYLVDTRQGLIPVEVKSGRAPFKPYDGHVLQLGAYCLLVEEQEGCKPPHGIIKYDDLAFEIDFSPALRVELLRSLEQMRRDLRSTDVERSHEEPARCRRCGYRNRCEQRLA